MTLSSTSEDGRRLEYRHGLARIEIRYRAARWRWTARRDGTLIGNGSEYRLATAKASAVEAIEQPRCRLCGESSAVEPDTGLCGRCDSVAADMCSVGNGGY